jgi:hypothetical protein
MSRKRPRSNDAYQGHSEATLQPLEKKQKAEFKEEKKANVKRFNLASFTPESNRVFSKVKVGSKSHEMLQWLVEQKYHLKFPHQDISVVPYGNVDVGEFFEQMKEANKNFKHYMKNCSSKWLRKRKFDLEYKGEYIAGWVVFYILCHQWKDLEDIKFLSFLKDTREDDCFTFYTCFVL